MTNETTFFARDGSRFTPVEHINTAVWVRKQFLSKKNLRILKGLELNYETPEHEPMRFWKRPV